MPKRIGEFRGRSGDVGDSLSADLREEPANVYSLGMILALFGGDLVQHVRVRDVASRT